MFKNDEDSVSESLFATRLDEWTNDVHIVAILWQAGIRLMPYWAFELTSVICAPAMPLQHRHRASIGVTSPFHSLTRS